MRKDPNKYPPGLNYRKVKGIIDFYDHQHEDDIVAEIEAAAKNTKTVMVQVPRKLLPDILKLMDKRKKSA